SPPTRDIVYALRKVVREAAPDMEEALKWGMPCYSLNGMVCYINPAKRHVTFGFYRGAELKDPERLLEGAGKKMRHVKVRGREDIRTELFRAWVREAVNLNRR